MLVEESLKVPVGEVWLLLSSCWSGCGSASPITTVWPVVTGFAVGGTMSISRLPWAAMYGNGDARVQFAHGATPPGVDV